MCQAYYTQTNPSTHPLTSFGDSFRAFVLVYLWPGILRGKPTLRFAPFRLASLKIIYISFTQFLFFNEAGRNVSVGRVRSLLFYLGHFTPSILRFRYG